MAQDPAFKDSRLMVNSNLIGIRKRASKRGARFNYSLRASWGTQDRLRGVLGKYYAQYTSGKGPNFVNFSAPVINNRYHRKQVKYKPIELTPVATELSDLPPHSTKYLIQLNNDAWNHQTFGRQWPTSNRPGVRDLLRQVIEEDGVYEGDPYWGMFLKDGFDATAQPLKRAIGPIFDTSGQFLDHTCFYYKPSENKDIRAKSGLRLKIESVYNFYADTTPPYEMASLAATEPMLTNFYCLESEMRNTGSTLNSDDYFNQLTLNGTLQEVNIDNDGSPDPWFQKMEGPAGGYTESDSVQLYTLYSKGLGLIRDSGQLDAVKSTFDSSYKNIVILNSDLAAMNDLVTRDDDTSGLRNLPFYNRIIIGRDWDSVTDPGREYMGGISFMADEMRKMDETFGEGSGTQFMDILQMYIVQNIEGITPSPSTSFKTRTLTRQSDENPSTLSLNVVNQNVAFYFDMNKFLADITDGDRIENIVTRINTNTTTDDNFILIRNYNQEVVESAEQPAKDFLLRNENRDITYPVRTTDSVILKNKACYNEPIMYKIDKRVVNAEGNVSEPVQTFYIGQAAGTATDINYIDSQVKYGVRYQYDIQQIRLVFGTQYSYRDLKVFFSAVAGYGRAVGNALGYYREPAAGLVLDDHVEQYVKEYTPTDKDLPYSAVGIDTMAEESAQTGYYIFKASNLPSLNVLAFQSLFLGGTEFVGSSEGSAADIEKLQNIELEIVEGFGFSGNSSGGIIGAAFNVAPTPLATGNTTAPPTPPSSGPAAGSMAAAPTTRPATRGGPSYGGRPNYGTPVAGTTSGGPGPSMMPPGFLNNLLGGN